MTPFSGSYRPEDTVFLLKPIPLDMVDVATKERLIQSGQRHYSELLAPERAPNPHYLQLFEALTDRYARRLATEIVALARHLATTRPQPLTVVSLARAGTPIGALLARALRGLGRTEVRHYSISIIRDRGIDENALKFILRWEARAPAGLVFVDGWTAKGVITEELRRALARWNAREPERLDETLYVVSDIGGVADVAATADDYAIPSGILNATVSGLTSRSILNAAIGPADFHGCVFYPEFAPHDRSTWFLDQVAGQFATVVLEPGPLLRFVRPRNPLVLRRLLRMDGIGRVQGFVLPKFGPQTLGDWLRVWDDSWGHALLPILETVEVFHRRQMESLRDRLTDSGLRAWVLGLRIGGNDLLNLLGLRRARGATIYDTPLRGVIADLVCIFHPAGYRLSAPVFEYLDTPEVLAREVDADLQHGLIGKTAIHPLQIPLIEARYRVSLADYEMALAVLAPAAAAVFALRDAFCEPATHRRWAVGIMERARVFGVG